MGKWVNHPQMGSVHSFSVAMLNYQRVPPGDSSAANHRTQLGVLVVRSPVVTMAFKMFQYSGHP